MEEYKAYSWGWLRALGAVLLTLWMLFGFVSTIVHLTLGWHPQFFTGTLRIFSIQGAMLAVAACLYELRGIHTLPLSRLFGFLANYYRRNIRGYVGVAWVDGTKLWTDVHLREKSTGGMPVMTVGRIPPPHTAIAIFSLGGICYNPGIRRGKGTRKSGIILVHFAPVGQSVFVKGVRMRYASYGPGVSHLVSVSDRDQTVTVDLKKFLVGLNSLRQYQLQSIADHSASARLAGPYPFTLQEVLDFMVERSGVRTQEHDQVRCQRDQAFNLITTGLRTLADSHLVGRSREAERWVRETSGAFVRILPETDPRHGEFDGLYDRMLDKLTRRTHRL